MVDSRCADCAKTAVFLFLQLFQAKTLHVGRGTDPDLDAIFSDVPTDTPPSDASTDAPAHAADDATPAEKVVATSTAPAQPERPRGPKKPWWDIYTSMLALTLLAIIFGCIFLVMEWSRYNFETTPPTISAPDGNAAGG